MTRGIVFLTAMYHDPDRVRAFVSHLRALRRPDDVNPDVVVVDNGSSPRPVWIADAELFTAPRNLGYFGGCAFALDRWRESNPLPEWICVSNSDLDLADDFLLRLFSERVGPSLGVIAPDVRLPTGARQNPLLWRRPSTLMMLTYAVLTRSALFSASFEAFIHVRHQVRRWTERRDGAGADVRSIYAAHGSIVLIHRRFFERGGTLRYRGCMYGEEIHLAEQAQRAGLQTIWARNLRVVHRQHATTRLVTREQRRLWRMESADALWREYFE